MTGIATPGSYRLVCLRKVHSWNVWCKREGHAKTSLLHYTLPYTNKPWSCPILASNVCWFSSPVLTEFGWRIHDSVFVTFFGMCYCLEKHQIVSPFLSMFVRTWVFIRFLHDISLHCKDVRNAALEETFWWPNFNQSVTLTSKTQLTRISCAENMVRID